MWWKRWNYIIIIRKYWKIKKRSWNLKKRRRKFKFNNKKIIITFRIIEFSILIRIIKIGWKKRRFGKKFVKLINFIWKIIEIIIFWKRNYLKKFLEYNLIIWRIIIKCNFFLFNYNKKKKKNDNLF